MKNKLIILFTCLFTAFSIHLNAQDWPQFLGPNGNSTTKQAGLLRTWPAEGPEVLWTVDLGIGFGGPVIKDGKAYLLDRDDQYGDYMRCFDMKSGKELWKFGYEAPVRLNSLDQEVFRWLMKTTFTHAGIMEIYIALILKLTNLYGM